MSVSYVNASRSASEVPSASSLKTSVVVEGNQDGTANFMAHENPFKEDIADLTVLNQIIIIII